MQTFKLTSAALLIGIGTLCANILYIPAGVSKCFPVQHCINVVAAVLLGPKMGVGIAFTISLLRNRLGTGSILAFPGSMIGAFCAALMFVRFRTTWSAMLGEVIGTGLIGGLVAFPLANLLMGKAVAAWFFIPPFLISTVGGSIIAGLLIKSGAFNYAMNRLSHDR